jgi:hypothetical protein
LKSSTYAWSASSSALLGFAQDGFPAHHPQFSALLFHARFRHFEVMMNDAAKSVVAGCYGEQQLASLTADRTRRIRQHQRLLPQSCSAAILRNRSHYLGNVQAPQEKAAEAAAVVEFNLSDDQLKRVVVQERD